MRYQTTIEIGVSRLVRGEKKRDLEMAHAELDRDVRQEVAITLGATFSDGAVVQRLATEVIRSCR